VPPTPAACVKNRATAHFGPARRMGTNATCRRVAPQHNPADS
jgi:hypothetical protein